MPAIVPKSLFTRKTYEVWKKSKKIKGAAIIKDVFPNFGNSQTFICPNSLYSY